MVEPVIAVKSIRPTLAQRQAERREKLIRAAVAVYGERGYANASVKAVCDAAGLTERYFYESFVNSEALLVAASSAVTWLLLEDLRRALAATEGGTVERQANAALEAFFDRMEVDRNATRVFLIEVVGVSPAVDAVLRSVGDRLGTMLGAIFGEHDCPPMLRLGVVGGLLQMASALAARQSGRGPADDGLETVSRSDVIAAALRLCRTLAPD